MVGGASKGKERGEGLERRVIRMYTKAAGARKGLANGGKRLPGKKEGRRKMYGPKRGELGRKNPRLGGRGKKVPGGGMGQVFRKIER